MSSAKERGKASPSAPESQAMAGMREKAKSQRRRIIYNNDGTDGGTRGAKTPEGFLALRSKPLLGTQVDSVFYCTGASTMFTHLAQVGETYGEFVSENSEASAHSARENIQALKDAGHDSLELTVEFCHQNGLEVFFSHRINDIHDTWLDWERSRWKREHPEYLMGAPSTVITPGDPRLGPHLDGFDQSQYDDWFRGFIDPRHYWTYLDFERPEVLDYLLAILEDVCRRYDIDGVEIDFFRGPLFFRPNLDYKPATPQQIEIMTGFIRRIREMMYREGNRRGRPILLAPRPPMSIERSLHVGIDVEQWLKESLVDILTTGGGNVPFTMPSRDLVELGHAYGVPVYPTISASGLRGRYGSPEAWRSGELVVEEEREGELRGRFGSTEAWRGVASNIWRAGADGVNAFNLFPGESNDPVLTTIGDHATLDGLNKVFAVDNRPAFNGDLRQALEQWQVLPVNLDDPGMPRSVNLPIGDDIAGAARAGRLNSAILGVKFRSLDPLKDKVEVRLNDQLLNVDYQEPSNGWFTYRPDPSAFHIGDNTVEFRVRQRAIERTPDVHITAAPIYVTVVEALIEYV